MIIELKKFKSCNFLIKLNKKNKPMKIEKFEDLDVWKKAIDVFIDIYKIGRAAN